MLCCHGQVLTIATCKPGLARTDRMPSERTLMRISTQSMISRIPSSTNKQNLAHHWNKARGYFEGAGTRTRIEQEGDDHWGPANVPGPLFCGPHGFVSLVKPPRWHTGDFDTLLYLSHCHYYFQRSQITFGRIGLCDYPSQSRWKSRNGNAKTLGYLSEAQALRRVWLKPECSSHDPLVA